MGKKKNTPSKAETHTFQASVGKLLDIVAKALYSEREVFLRELISNAADACDRLRFRAIEKPELLQDAQNFAITIRLDEEKKLLSIEDNGEGMNQQQLIENLGTIARSGTEAFLNNMQEGDRKSSNLIGQFGVGFYSCFMVADQVEVISKEAGSDQAYIWSSNGRDSYSIAEAERQGNGTTIHLTLKDDAEEFLQKERISHVVKTYSNHISIPVQFQETETEAEAETETLNAATALWRQNKSEIEKDTYTEFYRHHARAFDEPFEVIHAHVEGILEYSLLLFIPTERPFDLFEPDRLVQTKLYVKRVFITDECEELLPRWLRFVRGVIDSQDLPLNVSRELLQNSPVLRKMKKEITKRILNALKARATNDPEGYNKFFENFGAVLKEGLYEETDQQETLLPLCRFQSTEQNAPISLDDYVAQMKSDQSTIYYISGDSLDAVKASPQIEGFVKRGINVLCLTDAVDEFWLPRVPEYKEFKIQSITRGDIDLGDVDEDKKKDDETDKDNKDDAALNTLITRMKEVLGDTVAEVKKSNRLDSSPACFVAGDNAMDKQLEKLLKAHNRLDQEIPKIFEINPDHPIIQGLSKQESADEDRIWLLFDQTRIVEGEPPKDPKAFAERLNKILEQ